MSLNVCDNFFSSYPTCYSMVLLEQERPRPSSQHPGNSLGEIAKVLARGDKTSPAVDDPFLW